MSDAASRAAKDRVGAPVVRDDTRAVTADAPCWLWRAPSEFWWPDGPRAVLVRDDPPFLLVLASVVRAHLDLEIIEAVVVADVVLVVDLHGGIGEQSGIPCPSADAP
jgi:hypothetical protein